jgi:hypothetical protein
MFVECITQQIFMDKWAELEVLNQKYDVVEKRCGFPPKRRYQMYFGGEGINTLIVMREWESLAALEVAYTKVMADPEYQALAPESASIIKHSKDEILFQLP